MTITVYKTDSSPPVRTVLMTVDLLGLDVKTINVNTLSGEQHTPEYLAKNPLHTVPLLEEDDFILTDSHPIITYLVAKYGDQKQASLYPTDLKTRAIIDQRLYFDASIVFPKLLNIVGSLRKEGATGPSAKQIAEVNEVYGFTERYLEKSTFIAGEHLTLADISCVASVSSLDVLVPLGNQFPKVREWWRKLEEEKWYKNANWPGLVIFDKRMKEVIEKNSNV